MPTGKLTLISHQRCPYVQRAVISLKEKQVPFEQINIDLENKPDWFLDISPLGKTPLLMVAGTPIFESSVILEYLEETQPNQLHPADPLARALHRSWIEFGSIILVDIRGFYLAGDQESFEKNITILERRFQQLENHLKTGPFFAGKNFSLVDATFGPIFRYFDVFDQFCDVGILTDKPKIARWRKAMSERPSVRSAVASDYKTNFLLHLKTSNSHFARLISENAAIGAC